MITQAQLRELYDYEDGWLIHKTSDRIFGCQRGRYVKGNIDGVTYFAHRLIFLWHHGYIPRITDHIDGDELNNRIENLRDISQSANIMNTKFTPMRGIEFRGRKYRVRMWVSNERLSIGSYDTLEEAQEAYRNAVAKYYPELNLV